MKKLVAIIVFLSIFLFTAHLSFGASEPMDVIKSTIDRVIDILGDSQYVGNKYQQREDIFSAISPAFSFEWVSRGALASKWKKISDKEKEEFICEFSRLLLNLYYTKISSKIVKFDDIGNIKIDYIKTIFKKGGKLAEVYTFIIDKKNKLEIPVSYRVAILDGDWLICDVVIEGVSLVQNYKQQFLPIKTLNEIIERIKEKNIENDKLS